MNSRQRNSEQNIARDKERFHNDNRVKLSQRHNNPKHLCTQKQKWADLKETEIPCYISCWYPFCNN